MPARPATFSMPAKALVNTDDVCATLIVKLLTERPREMFSDTGIAMLVDALSPPRPGNTLAV
jgi:hypothetical protein